MYLVPSSYPKEHPAIVMANSGSVMTYGELEARSNQVAHLFRNLGCKRGDVVAACLDNDPLFLVLYWGAYRAGLYFTAISHRLQASEVQYIVNDCTAKVLITSSKLESVYLGFRDNLENSPVCYSLGGELSGATSIEHAIEELPVTPINDESFGDRLLYSSGTTGLPKGVRKKLPANVYGDADPAFREQNRYDYDQDTVYLSPAPLYHAAPLAFTSTILRYGGTVVIMDQFDAEGALKYIEQYQVTHSQWVPTMFVRMLKLSDEIRQQYDVSTLRYAVHAAAPCPVHVKEQMIEWWGPIIYEYYAGTEGNGRTYINSEEWLQHKGSVGRPYQCQLHIISEDDEEELPVGETGGVYFESQFWFEYLNDPQKTQSATSKQGWTTLGDVGYVDEQGYLYLTDRKSFMIISGGVNIYPQETENVLIAHPRVTDVAVFGVPNADFGEEVKAVVQPVDIEDAGPELEAELIAYAKSQISHIKSPRSIDFMEELPRHPTGKLYKRLLKDQYWAKTTS